jgi:hypothetical protein
VALTGGNNNSKKNNSNGNWRIKLENKEEFLKKLNLLRAPFPSHQISKLPKPTKQQTEAVKADFKSGIRCQLCGGWHHKDVIHLDYVGHAALTDRLLDADSNWYWEPVAFDQQGLPAQDKNGGLWIKLTVCGVTRFGYGHADNKVGGDAIKEAIGDALRNAAMRFGCALDLWHEGDLHIEDDDGNAASYKPAAPKVNEAEAIAKIRAVKTLEELTTAWNSLPVKTPAIVKAKDEMKSLFEGAQ